MNTSDVVTRPMGGAAADDDAPLAHYVPAEWSPVIEALEEARAMLPEVEHARAMQNSAAVEMAAVSGRRARLPPPVSAALSALIVAIVAPGVWRYAPPPFAAGPLGFLAFTAGMAALGCLVVVACRRAIDRSRRRLSRTAWLACMLAAIAGLAAFAIDGSELAGRPGGLLGTIGVAIAAAVPWLFARLATGNSLRLAAEYEAASARLAAAEHRATETLELARSVFETELASIGNRLFARHPPPTGQRPPWRRDRNGPIIPGAGAGRAGRQPYASIRIAPGTDIGRTYPAFT